MSQPLLKRLLLVTDLSDESLLSLIDELTAFSIGLEIFPEIKSEITAECRCVFAFVEKPPPKALVFLKKNMRKRQVRLFCAWKASGFLNDKKFRPILSSGKVVSVFGDTPEINVLSEVEKYIKKLIEKLNIKKESP
jgi:hypothetical protein